MLFSPCLGCVTHSAFAGYCRFHLNGYLARTLAMVNLWGGGGEGRTDVAAYYPLQTILPIHRPRRGGTFG